MPRGDAFELIFPLQEKVEQLQAQLWQLQERRRWVHGGSLAKILLAGFPGF